MKVLFILLIGFCQYGCNYSLAKSPLVFKELQGSLGQTPPGTVVSFQVINSSLIQPKCLECHSSATGDAGGINLETYENVVANLGLIKSEVASDSMPKNRAKLSANEKSILFAWIDAGGPKDPVEPTPTPPQGPVEPTPTQPEPEPPVEPTPPQVEFISYEKVHNEVIQPRCLGCHSDASGNRGGVNLETYENVVALTSVIEEEIKSGSMPRPRNRPLTPEQKDLILKWIASGAPRN